MKCLLNLSNLVIDGKNLHLLEKLLDGAEWQDYDYNAGGCVYFIKPMEPTGIAVTLLPPDLYETQKLLGKLTADERKAKV